MTAAQLPLEVMPMAQPGTWRTLVGVLLAVVCAGAVAWWWRSAEWPVDVVRIDGTLTHTDRQRLKAVVAGHAEAGFAGMDLRALRAELEALPWVRSAALRRIWPDTLHVDVREHRPVAEWNGEALVARDGTVFRPERLPETDLVRLRGPADHGTEMLTRLRRYQRRLAPLELAIAALEQDARRAWRMELANGIVLRLGRERIESRLARFRVVWPAVLAPRAERIEAVDLRYTNGFAIDWRDGERPDAREGGA